MVGTPFSSCGESNKIKARFQLWTTTNCNQALQIGAQATCRNFQESMQRRRRVTQTLKQKKATRSLTCVVASPETAVSEYSVCEYA
jgi:hypothetical protein